MAEAVYDNFIDRNERMAIVAVTAIQCTLFWDAQVGYYLCVHFKTDGSIYLYILGATTFSITTLTIMDLIATLSI